MGMTKAQKAAAAVAAAKKDSDTQNNDALAALIGSDAFDASYDLSGEAVLLGAIVLRAFTDSGLATVEEWNALEQPVRNEKITAALDVLRGEYSQKLIDKLKAESDAEDQQRAEAAEKADKQRKADEVAAAKKAAAAAKNAPPKVRVLCKLPNASDNINGVPYTQTDDGMLSDPIPAEAAEALLTIPGFVLAK